MGKDDDYDQVLLELTGALDEPAEETCQPSKTKPYIPGRIDVAAIRRKAGLSQPDFANRIGVPVATIRNWEQNHRTPQGPARVLLALLERNPRIVEETLKGMVVVEGGKPISPSGAGISNVPVSSARLPKARPQKQTK